MLRFSKALSVTAAALVAITSLGFTTIYAYRSDDITAFTGLYPIKQTVEQLTLALTQNPIEKAEIYLDLAAKRTREVQKQLVTNQKIDPQTLTAIKENTNQAVIAAQQVTDEKSKKALEKKIIEASTEQINTLKEAKVTSIKIVAHAKEVPLAEIATQDISLGTTDIPRSIGNNNDEVSLDTTPTSSETLIASSPELSLIDSAINDSKKFANENILSAEPIKTPEAQSQNKASTGTSLLDLPAESVSLSLSLP